MTGCREDREKIIHQRSELSLCNDLVVTTSKEMKGETRRRLYYMNGRLKTAVLGGFLAGALFTSAVPVLAWDGWHWSRYDRGNHRYYDRWDRRGGWQGYDYKYSELEQARQQLEYDRSRHAKRRRLAQDEARIQELEDQMWREEGGYWRYRRNYRD
jgi:hypothetical protein